MSSTAIPTWSIAPSMRRGAYRGGHLGPICSVHALEPRIRSIGSSDLGCRPAVQQDGGTGDYEAVTKQVTFTASGGDWNEVTQLFLCTSSDGSGKLLATKALSTGRTVHDGESLKCTMTVRVGE